MRYNLHVPNPLLKPYISQMYILEHDGYLTTPTELSSSANCYSALVLNFGDRYRVQTAGGSPVLLPASFVAGQSTFAYKLHLTGRVSMLGIVFKGAGMRAFFPTIPLFEMVDRRYDLSELLGSEANLLLEQVAEARTDEARFALVEAYLLARWCRVQAPRTVADAATFLVLRHRGMLTMDRLADRLNVSPRHLRRVFSQEVGMGPKLFARLKRFNYVLLSLSQKQFDWQDFLTDGGFYDQSHFIRDFTEFYGKAPTEALQQYRRMIQSIEV